MKKRLVSSCSAVIVQGRRGEEWAQSYGVPENKIFRPFKPIRNLFKNRPRAPRKNIVLFAGRLVKQKGVEHLITSFTDVSAKFPSAKLYIVGDGPEANNLKRLAAKFSLKGRVRFFGWVSGEHLASLYAQSRVFVLPSEYELWGRVIGEAAACGLPIVTTHAVGCVGDLVVDGYNGFIVSPNDPKRLAKAIIELLGVPTLCEKMGERSHQIAEKWSRYRAVRAFTQAIGTTMKEITMGNNP